VAEMDAGFQHLTHRDRHYYTPLSGLSLDPRLGPCAWHDRHPDGADLRIAWNPESAPDAVFPAPAWTRELPIQANVRF
jgi:hypothetical protein